MRLFRRKTASRDESDTALVTASLGGDREAFGVIVSRYQSLLCSLAYSSVGDLNQSEDIAQEAFVEAWKKLGTLKEPAKLKAWLCGILRFKISRFHRKEARQATRAAETLDEDRVDMSGTPVAEESAIRDEQQALLWQAMQKVPESYREPLILFYREDRSTRQVAEDLDLTEDAVKQRLSRGRKLLQAEMMRFVEGALERSKPGAAFTAAVLAVISSVPAPAKAASVSAAGANVASWFKLVNVVTVLATFSGLVSTFFGLRSSLDQSRTRTERRRVIRTVAILFLYPLVFVAVLFALRQVALASSLPVETFAVASQLVVLGFVLTYVTLSIKVLAGLRKMRAEQRRLHPEAFCDAVDQPGSATSEYRSHIRLAGVPLLHFRFGMPEQGDKPAVAWIAGGDRAYGLLFAWGGIAIAPVSVGIVSIGLFTVGAVGAGLFAVGTVGIGVIGLGAAVIAYRSYASLSALGWDSAFSQGFAIAKEAAIGPLAWAEQVNNEQAYEIARLAAIDSVFVLIMAAIAFLVIVPSAWHSNSVRRRMRRGDSPTF